ncbi:TorD/DmsD family molecular chaperone [Sulfurivermis fontis]|uniref:TorD/DmsD family molecular chaperone n=1 Tax=Sulfurivermis fontis TaxID=1972068 RepID=UPI000FDC9D72|nr:molecular chaperone TorD family protein [Sulfurivermis fontis]
MSDLFTIPLESVRQEAVAPAAASAEEYTARARHYRLLAGAFIEEPGRDYLAALRSPESLQALGELGVSFDSDFLDPPLEQLQETLACEYTVLFASSGGFPPVESVRLHGGFQQAPCFAVREFYGKEGFVVGAGRFQVFDDQLGVELQFVAALMDRIVTAMAQGDDKEQRRLEKTVKRFWAQHLGRWVRGYATLVERAASHSFYREMAALLDAFAVFELEQLGLDLVDEDQGKLELPPLAGADEPMRCGA